MSVGKTCKVKFANPEVEVSVGVGTSILVAGQRAGVTQLECCGLTPACGRCKVGVLEGEENLSSTSKLETQTSEIYGYLPFERVGCLTRINGDVFIEFRE